jgi:hypothetical protein
VFNRYRPRSTRFLNTTLVKKIEHRVKTFDLRINGLESIWHLSRKIVNGGRVGEDGTRRGEI